MSDTLRNVDFIIPAYNEGIGIQRTLESMLGQTFHDAFEVNVKIVANNCSDDTVSIAESQIPAFDEHPNFSLEVFDAPVRGKQRAINFGYDQSEAPYVLIGDADIRYGSDCLDTVLHGLDKPDTFVSAPMSAPILPERPKTLLEQVQLLKQIKREEDTPTAPNGALIGFKREAIDTFPTNIASEDTWLGLTIAREHGWEAINVDPSVRAYFKAPTNWPEFLRQEARFLRGTRQLLETHPDLLPTLEEGDARRLPANELNRRAAGRWAVLGFDPSVIDYTNNVLPVQIEETYARLKDELVRPDLTWAQAVTTKQY